RCQPGLGPVCRVGDLQQGQRDLLHRYYAHDRQLPGYCDRHLALRLPRRQVGLGGAVGYRHQSALERPRRSLRRLLRVRRRCGRGNLRSPSLFGGGNTLALGVITDGVFVNGGQFEFTTAWSTGFGYEHFWLPNFSTTVFGTYSQVRYNDNVINSNLFCNGGGAVQQNLIFKGANCDPGFNYWTIGTHTDWYPVPDFRLAAEVLYSRIETAFDGQSVTLSKTAGLRPTGVYTAKDMGILSVGFRAQRAFATGE